MSNKDNKNGKEVKLTWVQGPGGLWAQGFNSAEDYEKNLLDALWDQVNENALAREIEEKLADNNFADANELIARIKQQIKGQE